MKKTYFIVTILNLLIIMALSFEFVKANNLKGGDSSGSSTTAIGTCGSLGWCWEYTYPYKIGFVDGLRISIYSSNGDRYSKSVDFINNIEGVYDRLGTEEVHMSKNKKSKFDYISSWVDLDSYTATIASTANSINFSSILKAQGNTSTSVIKDHLGIFTIEDFINKFSDYEHDFNVDFEELKLNPRNYYLVVEPVTVIHHVSEGTNGFYYGTYTELLALFRATASVPGVRTMFETNYYLAKSIYLSDDIANNGDSMSDKLINMKSNEDTRSYGNKYGIGVMWFGENISIQNSNGSCEGDAFSWEYVGKVIKSYKIEGQACVGGGPGIDNCQWKNIDLEACKLVKDEKYYIATYGVSDAFKPVSGSGILAGKYFSINAPTVYHKVTYHFSEADEGEISSAVSAVCCNKCECAEERCVDNPTCSEYECVRSGCTSSGVCNYDANSIIEACKGLKEQFEQIKLNAQNHSIADTVGDLEIDLNFTKYTLTATQTNFEYNKISDEQFYYKTTFNYSISDVAGKHVNKYIALGTSASDSKNNEKTNTNYTFAQNMATTPINIKQGNYEYKIDYKNAFGSDFLDHFSASSRPQTSLTCNYTINQRDNNLITDYCNPNDSNAKCGDPNSEFSIVKLKMVYRPINLKNPFPGNDYSGAGSSRTPGRNWTEYDIKTYITENRDVDTDAVYQKKPIYVIDLNAEKINSIKEYNKQTSYDDFTLQCTLGTGRECVSTFLRDHNLLSGGTCANTTKIPLPDDSGIPNLNFELCLTSSADSW